MARLPGRFFCMFPGPGLGLLLLLASQAAQAGDQPRGQRKIVLIAGPITGHPKGTHEYEKTVILLKHLLDTSASLKGVHTEVHFHGWPADPRTLDDADTIVMISDGADRNEGDHPLYVGQRLATLEKQMQRGCGLVELHWTTFHPSRFHQQTTQRIGGYFDFETGPPPRNWYSAIQTWEGPVALAAADHPISRGVRPFQLREEFYYRIRFRPDDERVQTILTTQPPGENEDFPVAWGVTRQDGGRAFAFTGGHFFANWWLPDFRRLVLNAIAWTAGAPIPAGGIDSTLDKPLRTLIVTGHNHPAHDWRKVTEALIVVLEQDPRAVVEVTENVEDLVSERIADYDLLVMNYCNWDRAGLSEKARANFIHYLERGGGLAVIHFANGAFNATLPNKESDWPEYRTRIVRRVWNHGEGRSGHDPFGRFDVRISDVRHPITAGLQPFSTLDELYFRQEGELPIEPLITARSNVTGADEPLAWAYDYGRGRVFQTVLGHSDESIRRAGALIRRGSIWAARQTPLAFDPPLAITQGTLFREGSPWTLEQSLKRAAEQPAADQAKNDSQSDGAEPRDAVESSAVKKKSRPGKK